MRSQFLLNSRLSLKTCSCCLLPRGKAFSDCTPSIGRVTAGLVADECWQMCTLAGAGSLICPCSELNCG